MVDVRAATWYGTPGHVTRSHTNRGFLFTTDTGAVWSLNKNDEGFDLDHPPDKLQKAKMKLTRASEAYVVARRELLAAKEEVGQIIVDKAFGIE